MLVPDRLGTTACPEVLLEPVAEVVDPEPGRTTNVRLPVPVLEDEPEGAGFAAGTLSGRSPREVPEGEICPPPLDGFEPGEDSTGR